MRFLQLDLKAFGPFTDLQLDLSAGDCGLHLIYGPNEAGKSSTLRALRQLLFGIPGNSRDNFLHAYPKLRIGGTLRHSDGTEASFIRRKGNSNTLLAGDGKTQLGEGELAKFLGGMSRDVFKTMFGINHATLVEGGQAIVEGQGEIGQILFLAGSGISHLRGILQSFQKDCEKLFKPTGTLPEINKSLTDWKTARGDIRELQLSDEEWAGHRDRMEAATARKLQLETRLQELQKQLNRLQRYQHALPEIARLQQQRSEHARHAHATILPEDFAERRRNAELQLKIAEKQAQDAEARLVEIEQSLGQLNLSVELLAAGELIENFVLQLGSHNKAMADRRDRLAERRQFELDAAKILRELRPDLSVDRAGELRLTRQQRARIQDAGQNYQALKNEIQHAGQQRERLRQRIDDLTAQLAIAPSAGEAGPLLQSVRRIQQLGPLEEQHRKLGETLQQQRQEWNAGRKRLQYWVGTPGQLAELPVPALEEIEAYQTRCDQHQQQVSRLKDRIDEAEQGLREINQELERLRREGNIPTESELKDARRERDDLWKQIKHLWHHPRRDQETLSAASIREFDWGPDEQETSLAETYEEKSDNADAIADQLRKDAQLVERHARLLNEQARQLQQVVHLRDQLAALRSGQEDIQAEWVSLWQPAGIQPRSPKEMRGWHSRYSQLLEQWQQMQQQEFQAEQGRQTVAACRQELRALLAEAAEELPLRELLDRAERRAAEIESASRQREKLLRDGQTAEEELRLTQQQFDQATAALTAWQTDWAGDMARLGLRADATPAEANAFIQSVDDLFRKFADIERHDERIHGMDADAAQFRTGVKSFLKDYAADLLELDVEQAVPKLNHRLQQARMNQDRWRTLTAQQRQERAQRDQSRGQMQALQLQLQSLCEQAGCDNVAELPVAERESALRLQIEERLADLEELILKQSAGSPLEQFIAAATAVDADALPADILRLREEISTLESERDRLIDTIATERSALARMDGGALAAEAAEKAETARAHLESQVEQYAQAKLATEILRRGMERYRDRHQGPILRRAGELFAELTLGSFVELRVDYDDQERPRLQGVRSDGEQWVPLDGMSEGTCDQLYLALRLAALENYLQSHEPMPFIVDDILVNFDDARSLAALNVLQTFSRQTQVIFFTHHQHLVELAESQLAADCLWTHRLPAGGGRMVT